MIDGPGRVQAGEPLSTPAETRGRTASHHHLRARIIPPSAVPARELQLALDLTAAAANDGSDEPADASPRPRRLGWANLLARVFAVDVTVCRACGGRMRILDVVSDPDDIARVLHGARAHGARAPPRPPRPHPPGQILLFAS